MYCFGPLGHKVQTAPLVSYRPDRKGLDLQIDGRKFDVKTVGQGKNRACINADAHARKLPLGCVLVRFSRADLADLHLVSFDEVSRWTFVDKDWKTGKPLKAEKCCYRWPMPYLPLPAPECCVS